MPEVLRLDGLLAKIEAVYGTDSVPVVGTDGVRLAERLWSQITLDYAWENLREDVASGTILPLSPAVPRGRRVRLEIAWEVKGAGVDAVPEASPLYRACGMTETDGALIFDYQQASASHESCTCYAYAGGLLFKVVGCRGGMRWPIQVGQNAVHRFTLLGTLAADPATTALPAITYDASAPLAAVGLALTVGAWTPEVLLAEFQQGVEAQQLDSANAADGIKEFDYGVAAPRFTLSARKIALATYDPYADAKARTARAIALTFGSAQYNRCKLAVTNAYAQSPRHVDSQAFANWDLTYVLTDWKITYD